MKANYSSPVASPITGPLSRSRNKSQTKWSKKKLWEVANNNDIDVYNVLFSLIIEYFILHHEDDVFTRSNVL